MGNMIDYLQWRGDLPITADGLNSIDVLFFAQLSYIQWELSWQEGETVSLQELFPRIQDLTYAITFTANEDRVMVPMAARSRRFGSVPLSDLSHIFDAEAEEQFAAVTFHLPDDRLIIAFRGTDCSLVGWREDFKMACVPEVPAQGHAANYLQQIAAKYPGRITLCGHSKGGNLAVYAAATAETSVQDRIDDIYNFDGPGQNEALFESPGYSAIRGRLHTMVPASSIIGMLMCQPEALTVIVSTASSIMQHDPYTWQILGPVFQTAESRNSDSLYYQKVFRQWLSGITFEERSAFVDTLFDILSSTHAHDFGDDFFKSLTQHPVEFFSSFQNVDKATRQKVSKVIGTFLSSAVENGINLSPIARIIDASQKQQNA